MIIAVGAEEAKFRAQLITLLKGSGHQVVELGPCAGALEALRAARPHLLVAAYASSNTASDLIRNLRANADMRLLPVLCVNPKANMGETVDVLDAGADDAITRPFQPPIFLARVRTLLRRVVWAGEVPEETVTVLTGGPLELKLISRQALLRGKPVELTRLEFDLLAYLMKHPERVFRREALLVAVWNYPEDVETRTLDKHIESLRRKITPDADFIQTVHGVGYRFSPGPQ